MIPGPLHCEHHCYITSGCRHSANTESSSVHKVSAFACHHSPRRWATGLSACTLNHPSDRLQMWGFSFLVWVLLQPFYGGKENPLTKIKPITFFFSVSDLNTGLNELHAFLSGLRESVVLIREGRHREQSWLAWDSIGSYAGSLCHVGRAPSSPLCLLLAAQLWTISKAASPEG